MFQNLTKTRANISEKGIRSWFRRVQEYIMGNKLETVLEDPTSDETAFFLSPREKQVIDRKGSKKVSFWPEPNKNS